MKKTNNLCATFILALLIAVFLGNRAGLAQARDKSYIEEEVTFKNGEIILGGTLTLPKTKGKHPAIVLITGSGPQNRDEEILGFKIFKQIAHELVGRGMAVLRYDDRGVGKSTGNISESTSADFGGDVVAAIQLLEKRTDINPKQIGVLGHSEGGIVSHLANAKYPKIAFMVFMAGTSVSGEAIVWRQTVAMLKAAGKTKAEIAEQKIRSEMMFETVKTNKGWDKLTEVNVAHLLKEIEHMPKEKKAHIVKPKVYAKYVIGQQLKGAKSPWYRYFVSYDPRTNMEKITCPVLALFGEKDIQVSPAQNLAPLKKALRKAGNKDVTIKVLKDANHLFQKAITGQVSEYATLPKKFVADFLPTISKWLLKRVDVVR